MVDEPSGHYNIPLDASTGTLLVISVMGVPKYSARNLTQTYEIIEQQKDLDRTINGQLVDLSLDRFKKIGTEITCKDQQAPALNGIWVGQIVEVSCVFELAYPTSGGSPMRTVVSGSSHVIGDYTYYRPKLTMRVADISMGNEEYAHEYSWRMKLLEL